MIYPQGALPPPTMISTLLADFDGGSSATPASGAYPTLNRAIYIPIRIEYPLVITKFWVANGTSSSGNIDVGIYDFSGTRIVSTGSQTRTGTSVLQEYDITDTVLGSGIFYLALSTNTTTGQFLRYSLSVPGATYPGALCQDSAFPLPATATFASSSSLTYIPLIGATVAPITLV